jgi:hypothetical protein
MGALTSLNPTLIDVAKRTDPSGKIDTIVELLNLTNEVLDDMTFIEGNLPTGHRTTVRSGLPSATWRRLNYGVQPSKATTVQVTDSCGMLEAYAEVDKALADLNGNTAEFRLSEDRAFIEAMNQTMASTLFYGNTGTDPEKFMGLAPRFNALSGIECAQNIINGGTNDTDNTSIWLVVWGPNTVHGIYPKGSTAGLSHQDLGEVTLMDSANPAGRYQGYRTHYKWDLGLTVRDWRYVVRIANIEVSDILKDASSGADLVDLMVQALEIVPNLSAGRPAFYCNRTISSWLRRQIIKKSNVNLALDTVAGRKVLNFDGVPIRRCDSIVNTESALS